MPENEPNEVPRPEAQAPMLQYSRPAHAMAPAWQWVLGILLSVVLVLGSGFVGALGAGLGGFVVAPLITSVVMALIGANLRDSVAYRPMAAGIWTGVALAVLLDELCWVAFSGVRIGG